VTTPRNQLGMWGKNKDSRAREEKKTFRVREKGGPDLRDKRKNSEINEKQKQKDFGVVNEKNKKTAISSPTGW